MAEIRFTFSDGSALFAEIETDEQLDNYINMLPNLDFDVDHG